jgi:hypothetical protein
MAKAADLSLMDMMDRTYMWTRTLMQLSYRQSKFSPTGIALWMEAWH